MTQLVKKNGSSPKWQGSILPGLLAGDISAAFISSTLISPVLTAIDRAVVENVASSSRPLSTALKENLLCSIRHPRLFFNARPFFYIWTLYAATYTTANGVDSIGRTFMSKADSILIESITFFATCVVNVPLGVWKDVRFVQIFGRYTPPNGAVNTPLTKTQTRSTPQSTIKPAKVPRSVGAAFLGRDAITILGSFTLPQMLAGAIPSSILSDPLGRMAAMQLIVPVFSQIVATPVHLLGLDLYAHPHKNEKGERVERIRSNLGSTTLVRCARIIPAFGVGGIVNTGLRKFFHDKVGGKGSE